MDSPAIKRRHLRKDLNLEMTYQWQGETRSCLTTTLGEGGVYVQTLIPPPLGAVIQLQIKLPEGKSIQVTGEVRHSLENTYGSLPAGFGVQFLDLKEQDRELITYAISEES